MTMKTRQSLLETFSLSCSVRTKLIENKTWPLILKILFRTYAALWGSSSCIWGKTMFQIFP